MLPLSVASPDRVPRKPGTRASDSNAPSGSAEMLARRSRLGVMRPASFTVPLPTFSVALSMLTPSFVWRITKGAAALKAVPRSLPERRASVNVVLSSAMTTSASASAERSRPLTLAVVRQPSAPLGSALMVAVSKSCDADAKLSEGGGA